MDNQKRWTDATFKLIEYRRKLERTADIDAEPFDMAVYAMKKQEPKKPKRVLDQFRGKLSILLPRLHDVFWNTREKKCFPFPPAAVL